MKKFGIIIQKKLNYINKSKPSIKNNKQLAYWITNQQKKYKKNKQIMNNIHYRIKWEEFIKKYY